MNCNTTFKLYMNRNLVTIILDIGQKARLNMTGRTKYFVSILTK